MKNKYFNWIIIIIFAFAIGVANSGYARHGGHRWHDQGGWRGGIYIDISPGYNYYQTPYYYYGYRTCGWVPGHYNYYGYWVRGHRVCWY